MVSESPFPLIFYVERNSSSTVHSVAVYFQIVFEIEALPLEDTV